MIPELATQWVQEWMDAREPRYTAWQNVLAIVGLAR
jgi:hypothetical protein